MALEVIMAARFFTVTDDLEEHCSARLVEAEITDFVNDEEPWLGEHFHGVGQPISLRRQHRDDVPFPWWIGRTDDVRVQR
jgi:hypothetical protein